MYKSLSISAAFCLFLLASGLNWDPEFEKKSTRFDALPNCTAQLKQNETLSQLANCPAISAALNLSDPTDCCQYLRSFNCEKDILYLIPECKSSRFLIEMQVNLNKPVDTCVEPPPSCVNVTINRAITTVTENIFRPLTEMLENATKFENAPNCTNDLKDGFVNCMRHFNDLLDDRLNHTDWGNCCDEVEFEYCAKNLTDSPASCSPFKSDFDSLYMIMEKNIDKKCPGMTRCPRNGAPNVALTLPIFTFSLVLALFVRNVNLN